MPQATSRRWKHPIRRLACVALALSAAAATAQNVDVKDAFFAGRPALAENRGFQPTSLPAADVTPREPSPAAQTPAITSVPTPAPTPAPAPSAKPAAPKAQAGRPGLRVWLTDASAADGAKRLSPQQTFRTGDRVRLSVQPNRDGHLYVINVGSSGRTAMLFPTRGADNRVQRFSDFTFTSPLVFDDPPGVEQLVLVLADRPIDDVPVQLRSGGMQRVSLRGGGSLASAGAPGRGRDATGDSLDLALADLRGAKDLKFDDDGAELVAVSNRGDDRSGRFEPVVINLRLTHRR